MLTVRKARSQYVFAVTGLIAALATIAPAGVQERDSRDVPVQCDPALHQDAASSQHTSSTASLPPGSRGWETIPGVIRDDGLETFRLEVDTNGPVQAVTLGDLHTLCLEPPESVPFDLQDDGVGEDRVAADFIFTSGLFRYNTSCTLPAFYQNDPASPAGLSVESIGTVNIQELDGTVTVFLLGPEVGLLRTGIPETPSVSLSPTILASPHLVNIQSSSRETQQFIRFRSSETLVNLTNPIYAILPDAFDFLIFFSTDKIEGPPTFTRNFVAGTHQSVQVNFTGTGQDPFDHTGTYGSSGRLLGLNVLDTLDRGIVARFATHELLHQWAAFISPSFGLSDGVHYLNKSSVGSLLGGFQWIDNGDGKFTRNCDEGANGASHASALDKYMMGLIDGASVPPLYAETGSENVSCGSIGEPFNTVTIEDVQLVHGLRTPGPASAQREFNIGFVAESHERLLNPTEMTFYETLARHYTQPVASGDPAPYIGSNWVSIAQFFEEGTTWSSDVPLGADLSLEITTKKRAKHGSSLTYALKASNSGPTLADQVVVTDPLPAGVVFASSSPSQGDCTTLAVGSKGTVSCTVGSLPSGSSATVTIEVVVTASGRSKLTNTATVSGNSPDPIEANNAATVVTRVVGRPGD